MEDFLRIYSALSDATRLRIVRLLCDAETSICVCEIKDSLDISQYNVSYHLKELKSSGLVHESKEGRWVYYSLTEPKSRFHQLVLETVQALSGEYFISEMENLKERLALRENGKCAIGLSDEEKSKKTQSTEVDRR